MRQFKAMWSVDTTSLEDFNRGYPMTIEPSGLYEIWLPFSDEPQPAVAIGFLDDSRTSIKIWEVLSGGRLITQREGRFFRTGTARPPPDGIQEMQEMIARQIAAEEDAKILKLLCKEGNP